MSGTHRDLLFGSKSRCFSCKNHWRGLGPIGTSISDVNPAVVHAQNDRSCLGPIETCYSGPEGAVLLEKKHTWRLGPMETSNSDARHAVLHAENHRWGLGPTETCYSGPEVAVLHAKTTGGVYSSAETCNSSPKVAVLHTQNHRWELEPIQSFILVLSTLLCVLKTTDEEWDPYRLVSLVQKALFCM